MRQAEDRLPAAHREARRSLRARVAQDAVSRHQMLPWLSSPPGRWPQAAWTSSASGEDPPPMQADPQRSPLFLWSPHQCAHSLRTPLPFKPLRSEVRGQVSPDWPGQESVPSSEQQRPGRRGGNGRPPSSGGPLQQCFGQTIFPGALPPRAPDRKQPVMEPVMQPRLFSFNDSSAARHGHTPREPSPPPGRRPAPAHSHVDKCTRVLWSRQAGPAR